MKYKWKDKVRIKSKKELECISEVTDDMLKNGGAIMTIACLVEDADGYIMKEDGDFHFLWSDEMIEGLAEEEISQNAKLVSERFSEYVNPSEVKYAQDTITKMLLQGANIPNEYILKDENGNIINATKIVLEKKKKEYPKTYEKCWYELKHDINHDKVEGYKSDILSALQKLLICRDAYWKIAGEEMELGKPWEPQEGVIYCYMPNAPHCIRLMFPFPTEEMRDAFKENFDPDIEICKELL